MIVQMDLCARARPVNLPLVKHARTAPSAQGKTITDQAPFVNLMTASPTAALRPMKSCQKVKVQTCAAAKTTEHR